MKVIAFHLPQYHRIPENDSWWGEGFTEWENVKTARKYHEGQYQPRIPLDENYYNLLDESALEWQCEIAKEYGIYGFCFYHYWFNGHMLLEKPVEKYRALEKHKKVHYCICWANENWTKAWADKANEVLIQQKYGDKEEWAAHFQYFLPFFNDEMYIKENGKPLIVIYRPELIYNLKEMLESWQEMSILNGFPGLSICYQQYSYLVHHGSEEKLFSHNIEYQPAYVLAQDRMKHMSWKEKMYHCAPDFLRKKYEKVKSNTTRVVHDEKQFQVFDYDTVWERILNSEPSSPKSIPGAFIDFDNSPRRKDRGTYFRGVSIEKFKSYFTRQIKHARCDYGSDYLFFFAWNEWGESAYLEPDALRKYSALEAIKSALIDTGELEND